MFVSPIEVVNFQSGEITAVPPEGYAWIFPRADTLVLRDSTGTESILAQGASLLVNIRSNYVGSGDGTLNEQLLFKLTPSDVSKSIEANFSVVTNLVDAVVTLRDAPFGSKLDVKILDSLDVVLISLADGFNLMGIETHLTFNLAGVSMETDHKLQITVYNSEGGLIQDPPANFEVCMSIGVYSV